MERFWSGFVYLNNLEYGILLTALIAGTTDTNMLRKEKGMTAEGLAFKPRNEAIRHVYILYHQFDNKELSLSTMKFIDQLFPPDFDWEACDDLDDYKGRLMSFLCEFEGVASEKEWQGLLDDSRRGVQKEL